MCGESRRRLAWRLAGEEEEEGEEERGRGGVSELASRPSHPSRADRHQGNYPLRVWPARLMVAECACPATSCRPRTAYVCTQIIAPSVVVMAEGDGHYRQHRVMLPSGCKCMTARAALVEYLDEDYK